MTARPRTPFPGLRPFEFGESPLYFGRDGQSDQLIRKLAATRFVAVVETSGSGKSSLVRAGLLPDLSSGFMSSAGSHWRVCLMRPSNDPLGNLARALNATSVFGSEIEENAQIQTAITEGSKILRTIPTGAKALNAVAISRDGKLLATGADSPPLRLLDANTYQEIGSFPQQHERALSVALSPDGKTLATGGDDRTIKLWATSTLKELITLKGHNGPVMSLAFSPDSKTLASASFDGIVRLWHAASKEKVEGVYGPP